MTTLREGTGPGAEGAGPAQAAAAPASVPAWLRWRAALTGLVRRHWIFAIALVAAVVPRLVAMLGFQPAVLFRLDTFDYLWGAVHVSPNVVNPSGYSLFLWLFGPFHSLVLVVFLQHLLGLGVATMVYALVRRYGLPAWGATLAAAPVLFDPAQILVEQLVMADLLAMALMVGAFTILLLRSPPSMWQVITAGLMTGVSVTVRPTVLPLVLLVPLFLLFRRVGWRKAGASLLAGVIPVVGYMSWFAAVHGSFNMTNSNGLFLWSRTMSFANCAVIKPPADLQALCPEVQPGLHPGHSHPPVRLAPKLYLWNHRSWQWRQQPSGGFVPDTAAFTQANNDRALRFAIMAIEAQPFSYIGAVAAESIDPFAVANTLRFPAVQPHLGLAQWNQQYAVASIRDYTGNTQGVAQDLGYRYGTRLVSPYASLMNEYQHIIFLPGPVFALILLVGLAGIILPRRRTAAAALLWVSAVMLMMVPVAEHDYTYRYVLPAVPLACIAAAIALRKPGHETAQT